MRLVYELQSGPRRAWSACESYFPLQVLVITGSTDEERISTAKLIWRDMTFGQSPYPHGTVVAGNEPPAVALYVCRCMLDGSWITGRLNTATNICYYEYEGVQTCNSGQIQVYVGCEALSCPNDYPAKCEHQCPNV